MCDFSSAREEMVRMQIERRGITNTGVLKAMRMVPRHLFVPLEFMEDAYQDHPLPIGFGQTISQPYITALMTSLLELSGNEFVLEIGTGSGYQAAILGILTTKVDTVEIIPELALHATDLLVNQNFTNVSVHVSDGSKGWTPNAPYDAILVTAAAPCAPQPLFDQLKPTGKMVLPAGSRSEQWLEVWEMENQVWQVQRVIPVAFVPLRGAHGWSESI